RSATVPPSRCLRPSPFLFASFVDHRHLHSFPTRRSSDLPVADPAEDRRPVHAQARGQRRHVDPVALDERLASEVEHALGLRPRRSEEHTSELQSRENLVCRLLLEKKKQTRSYSAATQSAQ